MTPALIKIDRGFAQQLWPLLVIPSKNMPVTIDQTSQRGGLPDLHGHPSPSKRSARADPAGKVQLRIQRVDFENIVVRE